MYLHVVCKHNPVGQGDVRGKTDSTVARPNEKGKVYRVLSAKVLDRVVFGFIGKTPNFISFQ